MWRGLEAARLQFVRIIHAHEQLNDGGPVEEGFTKRFPDRIAVDTEVVSRLVSYEGAWDSGHSGAKMPEFTIEVIVIL